MVTANVYDGGSAGAGDPHTGLPCQFHGQLVCGDWHHNCSRRLCCTGGELKYETTGCLVIYHVSVRHGTKMSVGDSSTNNNRLLGGVDGIS